MYKCPIANNCTYIISYVRVSYHMTLLSTRHSSNNNNTTLSRSICVSHVHHYQVNTTNSQLSVPTCAGEAPVTSNKYL